MLVGIDVGGTKAAGVLVDMISGTVIDSQRAASNGSGSDLVTTLVGIVDSFAERSDKPISAVGLAIAGLVERSGMVRWSPNLPSAVDYPVASEVSQALGLPVATVNDATAAALAESHLGAGRGCDDFALVTLGTGIGAGLVSGGRLLYGAHGFAGEPGHSVLVADGPTHMTGQNGPWEFFASGNALGRMGREAKLGTTGEDVVAALAAGNDLAAEVFDSWCLEVARGLVNLIVILDLERVILGGGLVSVGEPLRAGVESWLGQLLPGALARPPVGVFLAELGDEAGARGAALLAEEGQACAT
ncbi:MAG: ROK family protein [Acidimicrobiales bacterium]|nr:ROK family protein [Acidimicrobiales bacterium]